MGQDPSSQANADEFSRNLAGQKQDRLPAPSRLQGRRLLSGIVARGDSLRRLSLAYGPSNIISHGISRAATPFPWWITSAVYEDPQVHLFIKQCLIRCLFELLHGDTQLYSYAGNGLLGAWSAADESQSCHALARFECHVNTTPNVNSSALIL
ncbi:hypothetical protein V8C34DRAFT_196558 [Trichoderma compactum]